MTEDFDNTLKSEFYKLKESTGKQKKNSIQLKKHYRRMLKLIPQ